MLFEVKLSSYQKDFKVFLQVILTRGWRSNIVAIIPSHKIKNFDYDSVYRKGKKSSCLVPRFQNDSLEEVLHFIRKLAWLGNNCCLLFHEERILRKWGKFGSAIT
ncbi:hypothetical protein TNIN_281891 [Trichonephila inaurata madagascariensis]|uniref:Uncharacterized protein n=1 Tax=Trichonephila inaurata madagascariensis TaxID=2747483 RepID=A0A8X6X8I7_9ARAC|nr:hypothetical protein TNIN_281891 [Trichonephila inaurata madagascariensis]